MNSFSVIAVADHLWQSTLFAVVVGCLTLVLRKNSARTRYVLWLAASAKFLVPFALVSALVAQIPWPVAPIQGAVPAFLSIAGQEASQITQFGGDGAIALAQAARATNFRNIVPIAFGVLWVLGTLVVAAHWYARWRRVHRALRDSTPTRLAFVIPVRSSSSQLEPGVVGIRRPVLLLPSGIEQRLTPAELRAVLAHEGCHAAWRDNLAATLHMLVEALFWFHPLIWWLGVRIVDERERACDEHVLAEGHPPGSYAEGILKVCEHYLESGLACVAGIGGANLRQRIESIMKNRLIEKLSAGRKLVITLAACATIAVPVAVGVLTSPHASAAAATSDADVPALRNVSIELAPKELPWAPSYYNAFGQMVSPDAKRVRTLFSLPDVIARAYGVDVSQVVGTDLSKEPVFLVTADNPWPDSPKASGEERRTMYIKSLKDLPTIQQDLLARYFGLVAKRERRQMAGYVLTVGAGGSKLTPDVVAPVWKQGEATVNGELFAEGTTIGPILGLLQDLLRAPVVDQTGLRGTYDYKLTWPPTAWGAAPAPASMATALEVQLGLHLEAKPVMVDVINVIGLKSPNEVVTPR